MAVKLRISRNSLVFRILKNPWGRAFIVSFLLLGMTATGVFSYYYFQYSRMIEAELRRVRSRTRRCSTRLPAR